MEEPLQLERLGWQGLLNGSSKPGRPSDGLPKDGPESDVLHASWSSDGALPRLNLVKFLRAELENPVRVPIPLGGAGALNDGT